MRADCRGGTSCLWCRVFNGSDWSDDGDLVARYADVGAVSGER